MEPCTSHTNTDAYGGTYVPYVQLVITGKLQLDYPSGSASSAGSAKSSSWAATAATPKTLLGACAAVDVDVGSGANVAAAAASVAAFASAAFYRLTQFGYIPHIVAALALTHSHTLPIPSLLPSPILDFLFFFGLKIPMAARPFNVLSRQLWQLLAVFNGQKFALAGGRGARRCAWKWAAEGAVCVMHAAGNYYGQSLDLVLGPFINTLSLCHQRNLQLICSQRGKGEKKEGRREAQAIEDNR